MIILKTCIAIKLYFFVKSSPGLGLAGPSKNSHRLHDFEMEVPSEKGKLPCPLSDEIPGLV